MLALGTAVLLENRDLWDRLVADPDNETGDVDAIVEELLRLLSVVQVAFPRFAKDDVVVAGTPISKGSVVLAHLPAANRDPRATPGDEIDLRARERFAPRVRLRLPPLRRCRAGPDGAADGVPDAGAPLPRPAARRTGRGPRRTAPRASCTASRRCRSARLRLTAVAGDQPSGTRSVASIASSIAPITDARSPSVAATTGVVGGAGQHVAAQPDPGRVEQQVAGAGHVAADHDDPGVHQVGERGQAPAEVQPGVLEHPQRRDVALVRRRDEVVDRRARASARTSSTARCPRRRTPRGSRGSRTGTADPGRRGSGGRSRRRCPVLPRNSVLSMIRPAPTPEETFTNTMSA